MSDGQTFAMKFGPHPRNPPQTDAFWATSWTIPADYPTGTVSYKITATDLQGNVQEWTIDLYEEDFYSRSAKENPLNPAEELYPHVVRGGSFKTPESEIGSAVRGVSDPMWKRIDPQIPKSPWWLSDGPFVGFRVLCEAGK